MSDDEINEQIEENTAIIEATNKAIDKIDAALPTVKDLEASDTEMDDIAKLATDSFTNLMELAMNVEARFSGPILQSASSMLGHAVTAKMAKMDKKLKMVDLQLKKARLDQQFIRKTEGIGGPKSGEVVEGQAVVMSRNDLLKSILNTPDKSATPAADSESDK